jgi:hypothetical protein
MDSAVLEVPPTTPRVLGTPFTPRSAALASAKGKISPKRGKSRLNRLFAVENQLFCALEAIDPNPRVSPTSREVASETVSLSHKPVRLSPEDARQLSDLTRSLVAVQERIRIERNLPNPGNLRHAEVPLPKRKPKSPPSRQGFGLWGGPPEQQPPAPTVAPVDTGSSVPPRRQLGSQAQPVVVSGSAETTTQ